MRGSDDGVRNGKERVGLASHKEPNEGVRYIYKVNARVRVYQGVLIFLSWPW